jgi:predicted SnoaL-like aldol condensation-catalyzing enzyme
MKTAIVLAFAALLSAGEAHADVAPPLNGPEATISNKALVAEMFQKMFVENKVAEYADTYFASDFIEHDPAAGNGTKALKAFFADFYKKNPKSITTVKRMIADGDLVLVHFHAQNGAEDRGVAGVDIFRVSRGKIVEHWDVVQPIPEKSANTNTMF